MVLWDGGTKVCSNGPGYMTEIAAMPIYGKNLKKSSLEPKGLWPWNLVCIIRCSSTTKFAQMMTLDWPWPILWQGQIWSLLLLYGEKGKTMDFSETIVPVVYDVKVGRCSQLNDYMNLYEYQRWRSFIDIGPRSLRFTFSNFFSLETARPIEAKFHMDPPWEEGMKVRSNGPGHMTSMIKTFKKSSSLEPNSRWPWKLVCSIGYSSTTKFVQMMTLGWPWPILRQGLTWSLMLLYGKKENDWFFRNYCSLWYQGW